jgi:pimeloyl-ACP methyl ester carboxylesterase
MLIRVDSPRLTVGEHTVALPDGGHIYAKSVCHAQRKERVGLYVHGSGTVGNHTIVERSARWMVDQNLFDRMILPDRRGCGRSSDWNRPPALRDHAEDMARVLDGLDVFGPVTALGISYGGPIVLTLAGVDTRVEQVVLMGSSPTLAQIAWPWNWLIRIGLVPWIMRRMYAREVGAEEPREMDFDFMYEWSNPSRSERWAQFKEVLRHTPRERLDSVLHELTATLDPHNAEVPDDLRVTVPIYQVIGERDETWGKDVPERMRSRFPNLHRRLIPGADHAAVLTRADEFHTALAEMLRGS